MKTDYEKKKNEMREAIKTLLDTKELDSKTITLVSSLDKKLDEMDCEHEKFVSENEELKNQLIESIKNSFSKDAPQDELEGEPKSFDEILQEVSNDVLNKDKK